MTATFFSRVTGMFLLSIVFSEANLGLAFIKGMEEQRAGNREFDYAAENIRKSIAAIDLPEVRDFLADFLPAFDMTLDELNHPTPPQR